MEHRQKYRCSRSGQLQCSKRRWVQLPLRSQSGRSVQLTLLRCLRILASLSGLLLQRFLLNPSVLLIPHQLYPSVLLIPHQLYQSGQWNRLIPYRSHQSTQVFPSDL